MRIYLITLLILSLITLILVIFETYKKQENYSFVNIISSPIQGIGRMISGTVNSISKLINILVTTDAGKLAIGSYVQLYLAYNSLTSDPFKSFDHFMKVIGMLKQAGNKKKDDFECPDDSPGLKSKCKSLLRTFNDPNTVKELQQRLYANKVKNASSIINNLLNGSKDLKSLPKPLTPEEFGRILKKAYEKEIGREYTIGPYENIDKGKDKELTGLALLFAKRREIPYWDKIFKKLFETGVVDSPAKFRNYFTKADDGCKEENESNAESCFTSNFIFWRDFLNYFVDSNCPDDDKLCQEYNSICIDDSSREENEDKCNELQDEIDKKYPSGILKGIKLVDVYMQDYKFKMLLNNLLEKYKNLNLSQDDLLKLIVLVLKQDLGIWTTVSSLVPMLKNKVNLPFIDQDLFAVYNKDFELIKDYLSDESKGKILSDKIDKLMNKKDLSLLNLDDWFWENNDNIVKIKDRKEDGTFTLSLTQGGKVVPDVFGKVNNDGSVIIKTPAGEFKSPGLNNVKSYTLQGPGMRVNLFPKI
jgi:hypothetical protein